MSWKFLEREVGAFFFSPSFFWVPSALNLNKPSSSLKSISRAKVRLLLISTDHTDKQTNAAVQAIPGSTRTEVILSHLKLGLLYKLECHTTEQGEGFHPGFRIRRNTGLSSADERPSRIHQQSRAAHPQRPEKGLPFPSGHMRGQRAKARDESKEF